MKASLAPWLTKQALIDIRREQAERGLLYFTRRFFKARTGQEFIVNAHHERIAEALEAVYHGQITNLIINVSPGSSKTELVSINFPAWCLAKNDMCRFLHLSYSDRLAELNSQTCRDLIRSDEFQAFWPLQIAPDSQSIKAWRTFRDGKKRGGMYATATGGQVTGFRAGHMNRGFQGGVICDDPQKPEDAESDVMRENSNRQIANTVRSRRARPDTPIVVIMQRLHDDDTTGFLLGGGIGETFEHIKIPAIDAQGRSYWEFKEPIAQLEAFRKAQPVVFSGQYMQEPSHDDGNIFRRPAWKRWKKPEPPKCDYILITIDSAFQEKEANDPSAAITWGIFNHAVEVGEGAHRREEMLPALIMLDAWAERLSYPDLKERVIQMYRDRHPDAILIEQAASGHSLIQDLRRQSIPGAVLGLPVRAFKPKDKSKLFRANIASAVLDSGHVWVPDKAWADEVISECARFPNGKHDDLCDAACMAFLYLRRKFLLGMDTSDQADYFETPKNRRLYG